MNDENFMDADMSSNNNNTNEVKTAMSGFFYDFSIFQESIKRQFKTFDNRISLLDRKNNAMTRPALDNGSGLEQFHKKAMEQYLRHGTTDAMNGLELENKGMAGNVASDGGYLVDPDTSNAIADTLYSKASIRAISNVVTVEASSFEVLMDQGEAGAGWSTEGENVTETTAPSFERISIMLHELSALPKATQRLLDDSEFDIENWLAMKIAGKFSAAESVAFITGDGVNKPKGFLSYPTIDNDSWEWQKIGTVISGQQGDFLSDAPADAIVDLVYALGAKYRANARFVMNSKTAGAVRKMKDADGRFLWTDGLAAGEPARLMGYPVLIAEDMPDISVDATAIAFGNFNAGYTIAERPDLRILRDPFSSKPHVIFYATKRIGGDVTDFDAIKLLKFSS